MLWPKVQSRVGRDHPGGLPGGSVERFGRPIEWAADGIEQVVALYAHKRILSWFPCDWGRTSAQWGQLGKAKHGSCMCVVVTIPALPWHGARVGKCLNNVQE